MPASIGVTFDCANPERLAEFWAATLGYELQGFDEEYAAIIDPHSTRPRILFVRVPEGKGVKNRLHLDLHTGNMAAEVERLIGLGGFQIGAGRDEDGDVWTVMADPEGNEFCVA